MEKEIWKPINGHEDCYSVSNLGNIKSLDRSIEYKDGRVAIFSGVPLKGSIGSNGYITISLGAKNKKLLHRIVAETFLGKPDGRLTVNHIDGNKLNNNVNNLEWCSFQENNRHARRTKLNNQHGENTNLTKYTDQFIDAVRNVHNTYEPSWAELGRIFGLTGCHARQIVLGLTRKRKTM